MSGCYSQYHAFEHFWPWLADALKHNTALLPFGPAKLITYVDYGCSGGANSAKQFANLVAVLEDMHVLGGV